MEAPTMPAVLAEPTISKAAAVSTADTRVVVIDDHYDRRRVMAYVVEQCGPDISVVGYADGCATAVETVDRLDANVVLLEIQLPTAQGLDTISALRRDKPSLRIVVCSFHNDAVTRESALERGADVYVSKPISPRDLYPALRPMGLRVAAPGPA
jgi:DNA-binding NarL/FixJ family response regulator